MDIIKSYFAHISKKEKVENYKIITIDKKCACQYLLTNSQNILSSQSLIKLLDIRLNETTLFDTILNNDSEELKEIFNKIQYESDILYENRLFFNFDPFANFLLSTKSKMDDVNNIINKIKSYYSLQNKYIDTNFNNYVNPYGLEKVVFTGGGTKGIIYIGALLGLFATGQLFYINHYAGTSIGALTAMVMGCITPTKDIYMRIKTKKLKDITYQEHKLIDKYQEAIRFIVRVFYGRSVDTFYNAPSYTFYGIWSVLDKIIKENGLYDPVTSGFQIWYALICKKLCHIMGNGLDKLIVIEKKDGSIVEFIDKQTEIEDLEQKILNDYVDSVKHNDKHNNNDNNINGYLGNIDFNKDSFEDWKIKKFFTFNEYNIYTGKTLVLTGTKTSKIETVYYTHTNTEYANLSVIICATASMSIPWVFKAPIINGSYNLDGGLFDNYPLTHCDIKIKDKITKYNNKIFGYLIDDKNTIIDTYELIRELWVSYNGFIDATKIAYLCYSPDYINISQLFFEIRLELYKLFITQIMI